MNTHAQYQELISRLLDEDTTLTAQENADLQAHLAVCPECSAVYEAFSALSGFVGGELEEPPASLRENVMAEIRREETRRKNRRAFRAVGFVAAAAVFALMIGFAPRLLTRETADSSALTARMAAGTVYDAPAEAPAAQRSMTAEANGSDFVTMDTAAAAAAEAAAEEAPAPAAGSAPGEESAGDKISMDSLLACLAGLETDLDFASLQLSPVYLIDTDGGLLEIYRYNNSLYYTDPLSGIPCEAGCSETALIKFLQN